MTRSRPGQWVLATVLCARLTAQLLPVECHACKATACRHAVQASGVQQHVFLSCCMHVCAGMVTLPAGTEMVMPGDNITAQFELINPVAMEPGLRFAMREGGRTVGAGVVAKVLD